jgi:hypothetical protein
MGSDVRGQIVRIDGNDHRPSFLESSFPRAGCIELNWHAEQRTSVLDYAGIGVKGGYRLDTLAIARE